MDTVYTVKTIWGDYAVLTDADGEESRLALALLPPEICEGDRVVCRGFEYSIE
ncbi:MAG: hypothetical protein ACOX81_01650 [Candidatus Heteroscillospira sp.]|jgi:hypothetical protein